MVNITYVMEVLKMKKNLTTKQKRIFIFCGTFVISGVAIVLGIKLAHSIGLKDGAIIGNILGRLAEKHKDNPELLAKMAEEFSGSKNIFELESLFTKYYNM